MPAALVFALLAAGALLLTPSRRRRRGRGGLAGLGGAKPAFKVGQRVALARAGFPGLHIGAKVRVADVQHGTKRAGYVHRYALEDDAGKGWWAFEDDVEPAA